MKARDLLKTLIETSGRVVFPQKQVTTAVFSHHNFYYIIIIVVINTFSNLIGHAVGGPLFHLEYYYSCNKYRNLIGQLEVHYFV